MAKQRKLGKKTSHRQAMLRSLTTALIENGKIETTEQKAKEVRSIAEKLITMAIKEKDNFEMKTQKVSSAKLDSKGNKVTEEITSKNGKKYAKVVRELVEKEVEVDNPSRLTARRKIMTVLYKVKDEKGRKTVSINIQVEGVEGYSDAPYVESRTYTEGFGLTNFTSNYMFKAL